MGGVATLRFHTMPTGCIVCVSHKRNQDGYFRYSIGSSRKGEKVLFMFHRFVWENVHGKIPDGYEIDHLCLNRGCCNVEHLQCIPKREHIIKTNRERKVITLESKEKYHGYY